MDIRGKEITPRETVDSAKNILEELGLTYKINLIYSGVDTYSHGLEIFFKEFPEYRVHKTNGKGITEEYSEASAFAEMIERISNLAVLLNLERFKLNEYSGKYISSNEKILSFKEVSKLDGYIGKCKLNYGKKFLESFKYFDEVYIEEDKSICVEVTNIKDNYKCFVPLSYLINDTNGMCAGNTKEEALCQGIFELFERYSHNYIIENKIIPPILPREIYEDTYSNKIIDKIENYENGRYKVVVRDCSLGLKIPIAGIVIFDKLKKKYRASFGASYNYSIALERCLTEILQNREINDMPFLDIFNPLDASSKNNMVNMEIAGIAHMPEEFLCGLENSYEFEGNLNLGENNVEILNNIMKVLKNQNIDIYYFDNSFLGMNCYKLLSFELGFIKLIDNGDYFKNELDIYKNIGSKDLTFEHADNVLDKLFKTRIITGKICDILGVNNCRDFEDGKIYNIHDLFMAVMLLKVEDIEGFIKYANYFIDYYSGDNLKGISLLRCLVHIYSFKIKNLNLEIVISLLENVYSQEEIKKCFDILKDTDKVIETFGFFDRGGQGEFNLCIPEFLTRYKEFINTINRLRIEAGK